MKNAIGLSNPLAHKSTQLCVRLSSQLRLFPLISRLLVQTMKRIPFYCSACTDVIKKHFVPDLLYWNWKSPATQKLN